MKKIGIIGGISQETTITYYRGIMSEFRKRSEGSIHPIIFLNSIDTKRFSEFLIANQLSRLTDFLLAEIEKLYRAGADFALLASNSAHIVIQDLQQHSPLPLLSIVDAVLEKVKPLHLEKVGLLGTRITMRGSFYSNIFAETAIVVAAPDNDDQILLQEIIDAEETPDALHQENREKVVHIIERFKARHQIEGLVLGATAISPLLSDSSSQLIPFFDSTKIHIDKIVEQSLD